MVNPVAVIAASIAAFLVGALWYGPLFGRTWRTLMNFAEGHAGLPASRRQMSMTSAMAGGFVATLALVYALAALMRAFSVENAGQALSASLLVSCGFVATTMASGIFYEGRPIQLYLINLLHYVVALAVAALVLFYW